MHIKYFFVVMASIISISSTCNTEVLNESVKETVETQTKVFSIKDFYKADSLLQVKVDSVFNRMSLTERVAQMIMPATGVTKKYGLPFSKITQLNKERLIGGVLFLKGTRKLL